MIAFYVSYINVPFGIAAYCFAHYQRFNEEGKACADVQIYRGNYLLAEVIIFWTTFFIMSFPMLFLVCMGKERIELALKGDQEDDEEEGAHGG